MPHNITDNLILIDRETLEDIISRKVKEVLQETLPGLLRHQSYPKWLGRKEVKDILHVSDAQLQYLRDSRQIKFYQFGRKIVYKYDDIREFLENHAVKLSRR
ncbi:MAG TPA: helix-turn-helix domain-containing protein [Bacteroidales bacterium]|nr:helix-turn-helix domain-containing protein [Bacteroidales bacterium]